jgi:TonB dependent receptor-like, beta-barrel
MDGTMMGSLTNATMAGQDGSTLGVDGIQEYRVITNSVSAEYGMTMGAQVVVVSKGGTNQFHGSGFEYLRNDKLDARNFFQYITPTTPYRLPPYRRNQFGGSFGGPIKKDKTFFFATYEALRQRLGVTTLDTALPANCRVLTNNPCTSPAGGTVAPTIAPILAIFPLPNVGATQYTFPFTQPTNDNYGQIRIDQNFSSNDSLFGRYTIEDSQETDALAIPQLAGLRESRNQYLTLSENHIFSGTLLNTARASFSRTQSNGLTSSPFIGPQYSYFPGRIMGSVSITGYTGFGPAASTPAPETQNVFSESDDLVDTHGSHTLKFGALINHFQAYTGNGSSWQGSASFTSLPNFLQGIWSTESGNTPGSFPFRTYHYNSLGFYGQDDWHPLPRFTVNIGLRYEFITTPQEVAGHAANLVDLRNDAAPTLGVTFKNPSLLNFSPRLGFAWDVTGDGKTSVRGGFVELYDVSSFGQSLVITSQGSPPYSTSSSATNSKTSPAIFALPFTFTPSQVGKTLSLIDYNFGQPHILEWNLTVERQLPGQMLLSVTYAGSRGLNLPQSKQGNPTIPQGVPANGVCTPSPTLLPFNPDPTAPICYTGPLGVNSSVVSYVGTDPYTNPYWQSIGLKTTAGESTYNSLQIGLNKRLSHGLQFQVSYTWSKVLDDTQGQASNENSGSSTTGTDPSNERVDYSYADFDVPQNLHFNLIYQPPNMFSSNKVLGAVLDGWRASTILSLSSGEPFTTTVSSNVSLSGGSDRPNLVLGRNNGNITSGTTAGCPGAPLITPGEKLGTRNLWYDPCAFYLQNPGFLGNAARNILRSPGITNLDFSLAKNFAIKRLGEGSHVEFRAEAFNIMNTPNFAVPARAVFSGTAGQAVLSTAQQNQINSTNGSFLTSRQLQFGLRLVF